MDKLKAFLNRLNGWQRLFAVYLVFWHIPATVSFVMDVEPEAIPNTTLYKAAEGAGLPYKERPGFRVFNSSELFGKDPETGDETINTVITRMAAQDIYELISITASNGSDYTLVVPKKEMPEERKTAIAKFLYERIGKNNTVSMAKGVAKTIFASLGIAFMIYIGGMAIGWVLRGFFRKQA